MFRKAPYERRGFQRADRPTVCRSVEKTQHPQQFHFWSIAKVFLKCFHHPAGMSSFRFRYIQIRYPGCVRYAVSRDLLQVCAKEYDRKGMVAKASRGGFKFSISALHA